MYKLILQAMLASLFLLSATAQRNFPTRKLYPDPHRPGIPLDSSQIKLLQIRQNYTLSELARIKDSLKNAQTSHFHTSILPHFQKPHPQKLPHFHTSRLPHLVPIAAAQRPLSPHQMIPHSIQASQFLSPTPARMPIPMNGSTKYIIEQRRPTLPIMFPR